MTRVRLSPRQRQCLALAGAGKTSKQIAASLDLSQRTVDEYIEAGGKRLGARNRVHAVAMALACGEI